LLLRRIKIVLTVSSCCGSKNNIHLIFSCYLLCIFTSFSCPPFPPLALSLGVSLSLSLSLSLLCEAIGLYILLLLSCIHPYCPRFE
jgi:hypothetical protein